MTDRELMQCAEEARKKAYAPYSGFAVGAALLTRDGQVFLGCNIENSSYSLSNCAEQSAFFAAVSAGERKFSAIAVTGGKIGEPAALCPPCGACRQVMAELGGENLRVLLGNAETFSVLTLGELLPLSFSLSKGGAPHENV